MQRTGRPKVRWELLTVGRRQKSQRVGRYFKRCALFTPARTFCFYSILDTAEVVFRVSVRVKRKHKWFTQTSLLSNGKEEEARGGRPSLTHFLLLLRPQLPDRADVADAPAREAFALSHLPQAHVVDSKHDRARLADAQCHHQVRAKRPAEPLRRLRRRAGHEGHPRVVLRFTGAGGEQGGARLA